MNPVALGEPSGFSKLTAPVMASAMRRGPRTTSVTSRGDTTPWNGRLSAHPESAGVGWDSTPWHGASWHPIVGAVSSCIAVAQLGRAAPECPGSGSDPVDNDSPEQTRFRWTGHRYTTPDPRILSCVYVTSPHSSGSLSFPGGVTSVQPFTTQSCIVPMDGPSDHVGTIYRA